MQDAKIATVTIVNQDQDFIILVNDPINANVLSAMQITEEAAEKLSCILEIKIHKTTKIKSPWQEDPAQEEALVNAPAQKSKENTTYHAEESDFEYNKREDNYHLAKDIINQLNKETEN